MGVAEHDHLFMRLFVIGCLIIHLGFIVKELIELFFGYLEEFLVGETHQFIVLVVHC